ncbi:MAG TPA: preprotein translocase subunit SecE [Caldisericia bacterium]|nr:preprotein translocase subunit SecE [Caldisericia bacterium]
MKQINSIKSFFQKLWIELTQKVTWPSRKVMIESTIIILSFILVWASLIGAIDFVFATGLSKFLEFVNPV